MKFKIRSNQFTKQLKMDLGLDNATFNRLDRGLSAISNYGLIYSDELEELSDALGIDLGKLQHIALELGYNVQ